MNNWIDDGHGNKCHRCKLGADCGLKVIEAGKARCWCQDQEASRCEVQVSREQIRCLEADNERLREEIKKEKIDRSLDGWNEAAIINELKRENAALLDLLEDIAHQHCHTGVALRDYNGQVAGTMVTDSGALTANGEALKRLAEAKPPRFRVVAEHGRMVVGYWPKNDPKKEAQP